MGESTPQRQEVRPRRLIAAGASVVVGAFIYFGLPLVEYPVGALWLTLIGASVLLPLLPEIGGRVHAAVERLRAPSPRARALMAVAIGLLGAMYFAARSLPKDRPPQATWHDEHMYLLQARMIASGRLWMPQHPMADFFESFHILVKPVYAPMYFPGTAMLYAPAVVLGIPGGYMALLVAGAGIGMTYRIVAELVDGVAGLLAALMMAGLTQLHEHCCMVLSHPVLMLLGLALVWSYLRWRKTRALGWALVAGVIAGWAAVTRPQDALAWAIPVGVAVLLDLRGASWRRRAATLAVAGLGLLPFLSLQLAFNRAVTGSFLQTPYQYYVGRNSPGMLVVGQQPGHQPPPQTTLQQKIDYDREWSTPEVLRNRRTPLLTTWYERKLPCVLHATLPWRFLLLLIPACVLAAHRRRWILLLVVPLFVLAYVPFAFMLPNYPLVAAPAMAGALTMAVAFWSGLLSRIRPALGTALTLGIACLLIAAMPWSRRSYGLNELEIIRNNLAELHRPALVLFRYSPGVLHHREPVYNLDVAWPDDAPVIRAQDLGGRNQELLDYYGQRQPLRRVYLYDRKTNEIEYWGAAGELAHKQFRRR